MTRGDAPRRAKVRDETGRLRFGPKVPKWSCAGGWMLRQLDHNANRAPCCALSKPAPTKCSRRIQAPHRLVCFLAILFVWMSSKHVFLFLCFLEAIQREHRKQSVRRSRASSSWRVLLWVFECRRKSPPNHAVAGTT